MHGSYEGRLDTDHQEHTFDVLGTYIFMCQYTSTLHGRYYISTILKLIFDFRRRGSTTHQVTHTVTMKHANITTTN